MNDLIVDTPVQNSFPSSPGVSPDKEAPLPTRTSQKASPLSNLGTYTKDVKLSKNMETVLATREKLKLLVTSEIKLTEPVLMHNDNAVIFPRTINVIQGQSGSHKSRLAENFCSAFIKENNCKNDLLGFKKCSSDIAYTVFYVDTERNLSEQFPSALQSIQEKAGYDKKDDLGNFEYISLLQINRNERFDTIKECIALIREKISSPLFIVLDVSTDCIEDFNKVDKSMELIDLMNMAVNDQDVIFLCIIHENPNSNKGRGHFGTELMNKASTVMQVGFEKDAQQNDTEIIRVKYLKCRSTARHASFYVKYSEDEKGLVLADSKDVAGVIKNRQLKANEDDIIESIEEYLGNGEEMTKDDLFKKLMGDYHVSRRTIETRITSISNSDSEIYHKNGSRAELGKVLKGNVLYYKLSAISSD